MEPRSEHITWQTIVGWFVLALLIAMVATPLAIWVGASGQPVVVRLAVAMFCASIVYRLAMVIRAEALIGQMTPAEIAKQPRVVKVQTDPLLARLTTELRGSLQWRIITPALWERLQLLCQQRGVVPPAGLTPQSDRYPTWQDAERMIQFLEDAT